MAFLIKYDDITNVYLFSNSKVSEWNGQLKDLKARMTEFSGLTSFQGAAADSVRNYLQDVHGTIQVSFQEILNEFCARFLLYRDGYYQQIDGDSHAVLTEDTFNQLLLFYPNSKSSFEEAHNGLVGSINAISDIFGPGLPDASGVRQGYETVKSTVTVLRDTTGSYETGHAGSDLTNLDELIASLSTFITYYRDVSYTSAASGYIAGSAAGCPAAADLGFALDKAYNDRVGLSDELTAAVGNEKTRMEALEKEWADQRAEDGAYKWLIGAGAVIVGVVAIVATAGAATPIVVAAVVAGSCSIAYGASNMYEAEQDIAYGLAGDPYTTAVNPIRDTVFFGNQEAYDIWGNTSTFVAGVLIPVGAGLNAARAAGVTGSQAVARVVGVELVKDTIAGGAGMAGGYAGTYYGTEWFGPDAGRWIGLGTGMAAGFGTGYGMNRIDKSFNWGGTNAKIPDAKIPDVLENGPYIKDGKPNGRPSLSGDTKLQFEKDVFDNCVDPDGILRDPNTGEVINWKPGEPRTGVVDFGHNQGRSYNEMFLKYKNGEKSLAELKEFQFNYKNFRLEVPAANRSRIYQ